MVVYSVLVNPSDLSSILQAEFSLGAELLYIFRVKLILLSADPQY